MTSSANFPHNLATWLEQQTGHAAQVLETHISWVILAGEHAYKIKKPVRFPFLDFSTPALRRHFCEEEVRLNRRLAPDLYLDVLPIAGTPEAPVLVANIGAGDGTRRGEAADGTAQALHADASQGAGNAWDWAICMQRFDADALLGQRIATGSASMTDMTRLARRLAAFHAGLAGVAPPDASYGSADQVLDEVRKVLRQLQPTALAQEARQWQAWVEQQAAVLGPFWQQRRASGFVRECHGDLHLGNIVRLGEDVTAFDCIDFQPAMRWLDTVNDVAFLTMDLQVHGRADLAAGFMDDYLQASGDYAGLRSWRFYEVYRALVRAMVAQLSTGGQDAGAGRAYADWLNSITTSAAATSARPLHLVITHGLSGSGKSTVARAVVEQTGAVRVRSDVERKRLFGLDAQQNSQAAGLNIYTPEASRQTFERLWQVAQTALQSGYGVVVDAAFLHRAERERFQALAAQQGAAYIIAHCDAEVAELEARINARLQRASDASEATVAVMHSQRRGSEPFAPAELPYVVQANTVQDWVGVFASHSASSVGNAGSAG